MSGRIGVHPILKQGAAAAMHARAGGVQIRYGDVEVDLLRVLRIRPSRRPLIRPADRRSEPDPELGASRQEERPVGVVHMPAKYVVVEVGQYLAAVLATKQLGASDVDRHTSVIRKKMRARCLLAAVPPGHHYRS